jgi:hypothetical protein
VNATVATERLSPDALLDLLTRVEPASPFFQHASRLLDRVLVHGSLPAQHSPPPAPRLLTVAMATHDDFDGVYFSIQAIRLYHPEVADEIDFLVLDNHPDGPHASAAVAFCRSIPNCRYVPYQRTVGTSTRSLLFRLASSEFVLCMDSHVLFAPGALRTLLDYLIAHRRTNDLLQGPLVSDDGKTMSSHFEPKWGAGMYGTWAFDQRAASSDTPPFDIEMHGLGVFVCRREAWPGFNPRLHGFGAEEGYLHEKIRRAGGRTLCLPFLRWMHRFGRPLGPSYPNRWADRIRNYLITADELSTDPTPIVDHFRAQLGADAADALVRDVRKEIDGPFALFDAIYCINLDRATDRWQEVTRRLSALGLGHPGRVRQFRAVETPSNHHIGCALSHRAILAEAKWQGLRNVLVFEDDVRFTATACTDLTNSLRELQTRSWHTLYLGGHRWGRNFPLAAGCQHLEVPKGLTCTHAVAYNHTAYDRILDRLPSAPSAMALWLRAYRGIDQYYARELDGLHLLTRPVVATQTSILPQETLAFDI